MCKIGATRSTERRKTTTLKFHNYKHFIIALLFYIGRTSHIYIVNLKLTIFLLTSSISMLHRKNLSHLSEPSVVHLSTSTCGSKVKARILKSQFAQRVLDDLKIISTRNTP